MRGIAVTVRGSVVKRVQCEKCQCNYVYEMSGQNTRRSDAYVAGGGLVGVALSLALTAAAGGNSEQSLRSQAQANLERNLAKGCEPVPCPACGWYQPNMVKESRRRYRKPLLGLGAVLLTLGAASLLVMLVINNSPHTIDAVSPIAFAVAGVVVLSGGGVLAWRWSLQRAYDINEGYPSPRPRYPGAPLGYDIKNLPKAATASAGQSSKAAPARRATADATNWYYTQGDGQAGPVTWADLKNLADTGALGSQDLVFATGSSDWVEAASVPGLLPPGQAG